VHTQRSCYSDPLPPSKQHTQRRAFSLLPLLLLLLLLPLLLPLRRQGRRKSA
jgi:hypothetical protein